MSQNILVVEDNTYLRSHIASFLSKEGYCVYEAADGRAALRILGDQMVDLIVLDLELGDLNGEEIVKILRRQNIDVPVIVISSYQQVKTKVDLFNLGCDDYVTKPFYKDEVIVRIRRLLQRKTGENRSRPLNEMLEAGPFRVDMQGIRAYKNDCVLDLNGKLIKILIYFIQNNNRIISKEQLHERFWDEDVEINDNTISVHIHMLRSHIEDDPRKPEFLQTKRGLGYLFSA